MMRRTGFTLLEMLIAISLFSLIGVAVANGLIGMRKAQGASVSANLLKVSGQTAINKMYEEVTASRKLLENLTTDTSQGLADSFFTAFQGVTSGPFPAITDRVYPTIDPLGGFGPGEYNQANVGNTLVFIETAKLLLIHDSGLQLILTNGPTTPTLDCSLNEYKFVTYYLVAPTLSATGQSPRFLNGVANYTYQLMRWESQPFVELSEFNSVAQRLAPLLSGLSPKSQLYNDLTAQGIVCLWDASASSVPTAFYSIDSSGNQQSYAMTAGIPQARRSWLVTPHLLDGYAVSMVSFNTNTSAFFVDSTFNVPAYAAPKAGTTVPPYGFEVAIVGPSAGREVLLRLALAARLDAGMHLFGVTHQEIATVFDM